MRIKVQEAEVERVHKTLTREKHKLEILKLEKIKAEMGIEVGSRVIGNRGKEFEVTNIYPHAMWRLAGRMIKKDGTLGKRVQSIWNWKKKEE